MSTTETQTERHYRCRHLRINGSQCGSPALRDEHFCFYHHTSRVPAPKPSDARTIADSAFELPMPENRAAIQYAVGEIMRRVAAEHLEPKTARVLIYALAIASANLPKPTAADHMPVAEPATEVIIDPVDGILAPAASAEAPLEPGQQRISPARHRREQRAAAQQLIYDQLEAARQKDAARDRQRQEERQAERQRQADLLRTQTPQPAPSAAPIQPGVLQPTPLQPTSAQTKYVTPPDSPELQRILRLIPPTPYDHDYTPNLEDFDIPYTPYASYEPAHLTPPPATPQPWQQSATPAWTTTTKHQPLSS